MWPTSPHLRRVVVLGRPVPSLRDAPLRLQLPHHLLLSATLCSSSEIFIFRGATNLSPNPNGPGAHDSLAEHRAARIVASRQARVPHTEEERVAARRQRMLNRDLGDFTSTQSVLTADEIRTRQL